MTTDPITAARALIADAIDFACAANQHLAGGEPEQAQQWRDALATLATLPEALEWRKVEIEQLRKEKYMALVSEREARTERDHLRSENATLTVELDMLEAEAANFDDDYSKAVAERDQALARLEAVQKENERLRESLRRISSPQYGLQGLIEDGASEGEITQYWANLASSFATTARIALRNPTAATPDPDALAALHSAEASHDD